MLSAKSDAEIAAFFDHCAEERLMTDFPPEEQIKLATFQEWWNLQPGHRVLEPGCGSGRLTAELAPRVGESGQVVACDLSGGMLDLARARRLPETVTLIQGSAFDLDLPDHGFDRIICLNVFPHFADAAQALAAFVRMLKPDGQLWINHFEGRESLNHFHHEAAPEVADHALPCRYTMGRLMEGAGLKVERLEDTAEMYCLLAVPR